MSADMIATQPNYSLSPTEYALLEGDLSRLSEADRLNLYNAVCSSLGLNPMTAPFGYIRLNGQKLTLYAKKDATDQLRKLHGVSITDLSETLSEGLYIVTAKAQDRSGRSDAAKGAISIKGLQGDALANAIMKCETKAKRRVTLSICGLGMLDESETASISGAEIVPHTPMISTYQPSQRAIQAPEEDDPLNRRRRIAAKTWKQYFTPNALEKCLPPEAIQRDDTGKILVGSTFAQLTDAQCEAIENFMAEPDNPEVAEGVETFPADGAGTAGNQQPDNGTGA